jgi:type VI secretion system secreted protein Hcp
MPIYMKMDGVDGLSRPGHFSGWHELKSFSWGMANTTSGGQASSFAQIGRINVQDIHFSKVSDKATALFMQNCAMGKHIAKVELNFMTGTQQDIKYATIKLSDVLISSFQIGAGSEEVPTEQTSLSFSKFETEFSKFDVATGKVEAGAKFGYDIKQAKSA